MKNIKCPSCGRGRQTYKGEYHYVESGLPNVWLRGVEIFKCDCGETFGLIPCLDELHRLIGRTLIKKEEQLSGREIRFLRKHMMLMSKEFAKELGVRNVTVSRWESGASQPPESVDRLIRLLYAIKMRLSNADKKFVVDRFSQLRKGQTQTKFYSFPARRFVKGQCAVNA